MQTERQNGRVKKTHVRWGFKDSNLLYILFYSVLFYSILFCSIIFYSFSILYDQYVLEI